MKALKIATISLLSLALIAAGALYHLIRNSAIEVTAVQAHGVVASEKAEAFAGLTKAVQEDTYIGTCYRQPENWGSAEECAFVTYSVTVKNHCPVAVERLELNVVPREDDYLQYHANETIRLEPGEEGTIETVMLCSRGADSVRDLYVVGYVWGKQRMIACKCGE